MMCRLAQMIASIERFSVHYVAWELQPVRDMRF